MPLTRLHRTRGHCPDGHTCPAVYNEAPGAPVRIVGETVTDPALLAQMSIGEGESAVEVPASLLPEAAAMRTDPADLGAFLGEAAFSLFRLETLPAYDDSSDGGDYRAYLRGDPGPDPGRKAAWHQALRADADRGVTSTRVRVLHDPPTPYERYSCEWGYALNVPLEDIRIASARASAPLGGAGDFWVVDGLAVALMHYDAAGRYIGFTEASDSEAARCVITARYALDVSVPFGTWWDAHPELRRGNRAA